MAGYLTCVTSLEAPCYERITKRCHRKDLLEVLKICVDRGLLPSHVSFNKNEHGGNTETTERNNNFRIHENWHIV